MAWDLEYVELKDRAFVLKAQFTQLQIYAETHRFALARELQDDLNSLLRDLHDWYRRVDAAKTKFRNEFDAERQSIIGSIVALRHLIDSRASTLRTVVNVLRTVAVGIDAILAAAHLPKVVEPFVAVGANFVGGSARPRVGGDYGFPKVQSTQPPAPPIAPTTRDANALTCESMLIEVNRVAKGRFRERAGLGVKIRVIAFHLKDVDCWVAAYFWHSSGEQLLDKNGEYASGSKGSQVCTARRLSPASDHDTLEDFLLFIPYSELHLPAGKHEGKFIVEGFRAAGQARLGASPERFFTAAF